MPSTPHKPCPSPSNIFHALPEDVTREVFESLAGNSMVKIERIISSGQASPDTGWYDQEHHEWVIVLQGAATLCFDESGEINLSPGDYIDIPAHTRHRVTRTSDDPVTIWLAVHYE